MTLQQWATDRWLRPHKTSREEIRNLLAIVERDLKDSEEGISEDWRFGIAYNAALKLCTILLYASGFMAEKSLQHNRTIQALPLILGAKRQKDADYLDTCRKKRNTVEHDAVGSVTRQDADELIGFVAEFRDEVLAWLKKNYPEL
jgi:hypothetical protein